MQNKTKATVTLAACATVAAGTFPFANSGFLFGLLNHGFIAATIGGLADWFAVTALFHKPLGISYRTEILKRNRKRISDAVIEFVGDDLLNTENIMETLKSENAAKLLIDFLEDIFFYLHLLYLLLLLFVMKKLKVKYLFIQSTVNFYIIKKNKIVF